MKYKPKKDLPFIRAGDDKVEINAFNTYINVSYVDTNIWIGEARPREWYHYYDETGLCCVINLKGNIELDTGRVSIRKIRVKEVL